jgi:hypothetical protein
MISMVVPTYNRDLACLERLLDTIVQHWAPGQLSDILILLNDKDWVMPKLQALVSHHKYSSLSIRTEFGKKLMQNPADEWGWGTQQYLKLQAAELFNTPWYIIHDSKDYYLGDVNIEDFVRGDRSVLAMRPGMNCPGEPSDVWLSGTTNNFYTEYRNAYRLMCLDIDTTNCILRPSYSSSTFVANTHMVRSLNNELNKRFGDLSNDLFLNKMLFTEYALISAWHQYHNKLDMYQSYDTLRLSAIFRCINMDKDLRGKRPSIERI